MIKQFLEAGKIVGTHGIKGMLRVQPWTDSGEFLCAFDTLYADASGTEKWEVLQAKPHGAVVLMQLKGIDTIEAAERLRNRTIFISRADCNLPEDRYFVDDLIGCSVFAADGTTPLGKLTDVSATGANDVWHITRDGIEYLVPAVAEVIVSIDPANDKIILNPMKGIFDDAD